MINVVFADIARRVGWGGGSCRDAEVPAPPSSGLENRRESRRAILEALLVPERGNATR